MQSSFWHQVPFVRIVLPFTAGISLAMFVPLSLYNAGWLLASVFLLYIGIVFMQLHFSRQWKQGIVLHVLLLCLGFWLNKFQSDLNKPFHYTKLPGKYLLLKINEPLLARANSYKTTSNVLGVFDSNGKERFAEGKLLLYFSKDSFHSELRYGDVLLIPSALLAEIPKAMNPHEFDHRRYLSFNQLFRQAYLKAGSYARTGVNMANPLYTSVYACQEYFISVLNEYIRSPKEVAVAKALIYGYDDDIDSEIVRAYANTGTLHVLAVSGMHVGLIFIILNSVLKYLDKRRSLKWMKPVITLLLIWIYSLICGMSPSILRASVMFSFIAMGKSFNRNVNVFNVLSASAFVLLCFDSNMLANVGFQLSFLAVAGIVGLQPYIYNWFAFNSRLADNIWNIIAVSLAAQLATYPVGLLYFHQFPNLFLLSNLLIIPITTAVIYGGIALIALSKLSLLAVWLGFALKWTIWFTNQLVMAIDRIPYSYINGIHISIPETLLIYLFTAFFISYFALRNSRYVKAALLSAVLLAGINLGETVVQQKQHSLTVYRVNKHLVIQYCSGTEAILFMDSACMANEDKFRFHIQQNLWANGISKLEKRMMKGAILVHDEGLGNMYVPVKNSRPPAARTPVDILLLRGHDPVRLFNAGGIRPGNKILFNTDIPITMTSKLRQIATERKIAYHDIGESGAFELSLH